ncbi:MAG: S49 family peptidase [Alphaproteobacteria bacterium]
MSIFGSIGRRLPGLRGAAPVVAVVRLVGPIGMVGIRPGLMLVQLAPVLERAFALRHLAAVAIIVNSPGGSAVQSALIASRIRALAAERSVPVIAFVEDVAASGGYWLACAGDEIVVHEASIVGSIGVVAASFGFQDLIRRFGIERRLHTSGELKAQLDPFAPEDPAEVARLEALLGDMHDTFNRMVKERRGARLKADDGTLFSGEFWTGRKALDLGLVDGFGEVRSVMRARYGERVRLRVVGARQPLLQRLSGRSSLTLRVAGGSDGARGLADAVVGVLEERAMWGRFGL